MTRPRVELATLVELETDAAGALGYDDARIATQHVEAAQGRAQVVVRGVLRAHCADVARLVGAALFDASEIEVFARGPEAVWFAEAVAASAEEEQAFRRQGQQGAA